MTHQWSYVSCCFHSYERNGGGVKNIFANGEIFCTKTLLIYAKFASYFFFKTPLFAENRRKPLKKEDDHNNINPWEKHFLVEKSTATKIPGF
jgi:hypothetical protein